MGSQRIKNVAVSLTAPLAFSWEEEPLSIARIKKKEAGSIENLASFFNVWM